MVRPGRSRRVKTREVRVRVDMFAISGSPEEFFQPVGGKG
jgi:hypothetical protein